MASITPAPAPVNATAATLRNLLIRWVDLVAEFDDAWGDIPESAVADVSERNVDEARTVLLEVQQALTRAYAATARPAGRRVG